MALTLMPCGPSSVASDAVRLTSASLLMPYKPPPAMNAPAETWLMIRPPPRASIEGRTACVHTSAPMTFTRTTRSNQSSGSVASDVRGISFISAALLTRMSIPPKRSTAPVGHRPRRLRIGDVDTDPDRRVAVSRQLRRGVIGLLAFQIGEHDRGADLGERPAVHLADPAGATRDDGDLAVQ